jgi:hypothetical protein
MNNVTHPNPEQIEALQRYADYRGAEWKYDLATDWMRSNYNMPIKNADDSCLLQQVRNQCGTRWLNSKSNKIEPKNA